MPSLRGATELLQTGPYMQIFINTVITIIIIKISRKIFSIKNNDVEGGHNPVTE